MNYIKKEFKNIFKKIWRHFM